MSRPLAVHIDRIVLDEAVLGGVALTARTRQALQAAIVQAIERALAERAPGGAWTGPATGATLDRLQAGELHLSPGAGASALGSSLGTQVAAALQTGLP